jgi:divalent metal cation (Fe/Co/Zn/Cd) transporter
MPKFKAMALYILIKDKIISSEYIKKIKKHVGTHLPLLDSVTAVIVGFLIYKTAWDIFKEASHCLIYGFDEQQLGEYKGTILNTPGAKSVKDIKVRN